MFVVDFSSDVLEAAGKKETSGEDGVPGGGKSKSTPITSTSSNLVEVSPEEKLYLVTSSRSVENMPKWAHYFARTEMGVLCIPCEKFFCNMILMKVLVIQCQIHSVI